MQLAYSIAASDKMHRSLRYSLQGRLFGAQKAHLRMTMP
jgi:hypothetical protein